MKENLEIEIALTLELDNYDFRIGIKKRK